MSLLPAPESATNFASFSQSYSGPSSTNSSPELSIRPSSPQDTRSKNARAQARHRAKRKAYVENLENTVHQLRAALASTGASPDIGAQIQYLEQENARLRSESQSLRAQLGQLAPGSNSPTSATTLSPYSATSPYSTDNSAGLRLPSVADAMNFRTSPTSYGTGHPNYLAEDTSRSRYYESSSDYRRRVSQPYSVPRRDSAPTPGVYDKYDSERMAGSGTTSRSSQRSYQASPTSESTANYTYSQQLYGSTTTFPPASNTAGAYVFNSDDVKPTSTTFAQ